MATLTFWSRGSGEHIAPGQCPYERSKPDGDGFEHCVLPAGHFDIVRDRPIGHRTIFELNADLKAAGLPTTATRFCKCPDPDHPGWNKMVGCGRRCETCGVEGQRLPTDAEKVEAVRLAEARSGSPSLAHRTCPPPPEDEYSPWERGGDYPVGCQSPSSLFRTDPDGRLLVTPLALDNLMEDARAWAYNAGITRTANAVGDVFNELESPTERLARIKANGITPSMAAREAREGARLGSESFVGAPDDQYRPPNGIWSLGEIRRMLGEMPLWGGGDDQWKPAAIARTLLAEVDRLRACLSDGEAAEAEAERMPGATVRPPLVGATHECPERSAGDLARWRVALCEDDPPRDVLRGWHLLFDGRISVRVSFCPWCGDHLRVQDAPPTQPGDPPDDMEAELTALLNRHSCEGKSDTPDFLLARYLMMCLNAWNCVTRAREQWYGRGPTPCSPPDSATGGATGNQPQPMYQTPGEAPFPVPVEPHVFHPTRPTEEGGGPCASCGFGSSAAVHVSPGPRETSRSSITEIMQSPGMRHVAESAVRDAVESYTRSARAADIAASQAPPIRECPTCRGEGTVPMRSDDLGVRGAFPAKCEDCGGSGTADPEVHPPEVEP